MKIMKFEGSSMREALAKVKAELGDQAVVVSTRQVRKGLIGQAYEISAAIDDDEPQPVPAASLPPPPPASIRPRAALDDDEVERVVGPLRAELRSLRALVRGQTDRPSAKIEQELLALRRAVEELRRPTPSTTTALVERAPTSDVVLAAPSRARAVLLVGPTGVGKTTTIAKIAARAALVEGKKVALCTLDNYRVGGVEQIRTFADLIGVPLHVVEDPAQLAEQLTELSDYDRVLIDTAGKSPRDKAGLDALRAVTAVPQIEVHLTVAAGTPAAQIDELLRRYSGLQPRRLLFTKIDEVEAAPELTLAPARLRLPVTWLGTGQAVPEDLEVATAARLHELASRGLDGSKAAA